MIVKPAPKLRQTPICTRIDINASSWPPAGFTVTELRYFNETGGF